MIILLVLFAALSSFGSLLPISGTFIDPLYDARLTSSNGPGFLFSCSDWTRKILEMNLTVVIFQTVHDARFGTFYPSKLPWMRAWPGKCKDVVGAVLAAAETKVFLSCEFVNTEDDPVNNATIMEGRIAIMKELAALYGHHASLAGWYFASEAYLSPYFQQDFLNYVSTLAAVARQVTPGALIFISPYGTRFARNDTTFIAQLGVVDVDVIAYQDEVGCVRDELPIVTSGKAFRALRAAHDAVGNRVKLWANIESFTWKHLPNNVSSPLIPAPYPRLMYQQRVVTDVAVERIITFTRQGICEPPNTPLPWGPPDAKRQWNDYHKQNRVAAAVTTGHVRHKLIGPIEVDAGGVKCTPGALGNLTDGITGPLDPGAPEWRSFTIASRESALCRVTFRLPKPLRFARVATNFLQASQFWFVDGDASRPVRRNVTAYLPMGVNFYGDNNALLGSVSTDFWAQEFYDTRNQVYEVEGDFFARNEITVEFTAAIPSWAKTSPYRVMMDELMVDPVVVVAQDDATDISLCNILVLGGSTSSLAAALAAAQSNSSITVCLTDPTDWIGGQMTASAVSAIDFGKQNSPDEYGKNLPLSFLKLVNLFSESTGRCWVSERCYEPQIMLDALEDQVKALSNLRVFLNTVVVNVTTDAASGRISQVVAVQRSPQAGVDAWGQRTSSMLRDWYSVVPSALFRKEVLTFHVDDRAVVVDGTEFGDLIDALGVGTTGMETPTEDSDSYLATCGQSFTQDLYMYAQELGTRCAFEPVPQACPSCNFTLDGFTADQLWTYRRVRASGNSTVVAGQVSLQNFDTMDEPHYLFSESGGINITSLARGEERSLAWFQWYRKQFPHLTMCLSRDQVGTAHGLAKMPYLRDSRRVRRGVLGFRLTRAMLGNATHFNDTIGIGIYPVDHHMADCGTAFPPYIDNHEIVPFYLPFRALTVDSVPNLLVSGKTMAQSWLANAPTRLHPEEWVTGEAAGISAALWYLGDWKTSLKALSKVSDIQHNLLSIGHPLQWK